jgi:probable HAF family extracellular repeat protein
MMRVAVARAGLWRLGGALCAALASVDARAEVVFRGLGDLSGGAVSSTAHGVSADGSTVVGESEGAKGTEAFRWTVADGIVGLGFLPGGAGSVARAASADGSLIVGSAEGPLGTDAVLWIDDAVEPIDRSDGAGVLESHATAVSSDGNAIAGYRVGGEAGAERAWLLGPGDAKPLELPDPDGQGLASRALGISDDGGTVAGWRTFDTAGVTRREAMLWVARAPVGLGDLIAGHEMIEPGSDSVGLGLSGDGLTLVGSAGERGHAFSLSAQRFACLERQDGLCFKNFGSATLALDASRDGSVIVGSVTPPFDAAMLAVGDRFDNLQALLEQQFGLAVGWTLGEATGVSADGTTLVGNGVNPSGEREAWIVRISPSHVTARLARNGDLVISGNRASQAFVLQATASGVEVRGSERLLGLERTLVNGEPSLVFPRTRRIVVETGGGVDDVRAVALDSELRIHSGSGADRVRVESLRGDLRIRSGSGDDRVELRGSIDGDLELRSGSGHDFVTAFGVAVRGHARLYASDGDDTIEHGISAERGSRVSTGDGADVVRFVDAFAPSGAVRVYTGDGDDRVYSEDEDAISFDFPLTVFASRGDDRVEIGEDSTVLAPLRVSGGDGDDFVKLRAVEAAGKLGIAVGNGDDRVVLLDSRLHQVELRTDGGSDSLCVSDTSLGGRFAAALGSGNDSAHLERASFRAALRLEADRGRDRLTDDGASDLGPDPRIRGFETKAADSARCATEF